MIKKISDKEKPCPRCGSEVEDDDLRCPICGRVSPFSDAERRDQTQVKILRCENCGAAVSYSVAVQAPKCGFCGSVTHVETPTDPVREAEKFLPFKVSESQAKGALRKWLSGLGFFRPSDLSQVATVEKIRPLWWAGWLTDAEVFTTWNADTDYGSRRARWAPVSGKTTLNFENLLISASRGLTRRETIRLTRHYRLSSVADSPDDTPGAEVESFELQRSAARRFALRVIGNSAKSKLCERHIPGTRHRRVHTALRISGMRTVRLGLPVYVLAYRYKGEPYRAIVNGQDPRNAFGDAPYSWTKIVLVAGATLLGVVVLLLLVLLFG